MKIKRFGVMSFLIIVNVLILTHVVVPHHHHNNLPCFTIDEIQSCCNHEEHTSGEHNSKGYDHHNNQGKEGSCAIEEFVVIDHHSQKVDLKCPVYLHDQAGHLLQAVLSIFDYNLLIPDKQLLNRDLPYFISYHSTYVSQNLGLRAPPF